jgi:hypothetical protein
VLRDPGAHKGQTYRLGYNAKTYDEIAKIFTQVIGQPFSYEPRPPNEFLDKVLSAGGEPVYMDCVYDSYSRLSRESIPGSDETFDNFTRITGRQPNSLIDGFQFILSPSQSPARTFETVITDSVKARELVRPKLADCLFASQLHNYRLTCNHARLGITNMRDRFSCYKIQFLNQLRGVSHAIAKFEI